MPIILATQETEIRRIVVKNQIEQIVHETLFGKKKIHHTKGLVEWLKLQALSSNPFLYCKKKRTRGKLLKHKK
jgi:hypothetical protein